MKTQMVREDQATKPPSYRTLADVARALDLDPSTISLVLSGSTKPSAKTRERVMAFCRKVNFRPNLLARGLSRGRSGLIGVLFPDIRSSLFAAVLEGIETVANEVQCTPFLSLSKYDPELMRSQIGSMKARYVDGLIIVPTGQPGEREILQPVLEDVAKVFVMIPFEGETADSCVRTDDELGGYLGTKHLIALGHRRIGMVCGPRRWPSSKARHLGWAKALTEAGLEADPALMSGHEFSRAAGYASAKALLEVENPPTALMCVSDVAALGAMQLVMERGLRPGRDIAIVGYDDVCCGRNSPIPLTTIHQPQEELGERAARLLMKVIAGESADFAPMPPHLVVRSSCGGLHAGNGSK